MKPSVGRVVHATIDGECHAAIVIGAYPDPSIVDLAVFNRNHGYEQWRELYLDPQAPGEAAKDEHWHWPEQVS